VGQLKLQMDYLYLRWRSVVGWLTAIVLAVVILLPGQEQHQNASQDSPQNRAAQATTESEAAAISCQCPRGYRARLVPICL